MKKFHSIDPQKLQNDPQYRFYKTEVIDKFPVLKVTSISFISSLLYVNMCRETVLDFYVNEFKKAFRLVEIRMPLKKKLHASICSIKTTRSIL